MLSILIIIIYNLYQLIKNLTVYLLDYITIIALIWHRENVFNTHTITYHFFCMGSVCKNISTLWSTFQKTTLLLAMIKTTNKKHYKTRMFYAFFQCIPPEKDRWRSPLPRVLVDHIPLLFATELGSG